MADTRVQLEIEGWVRSDWLSRKYGQQFTKRKLPLSPGGQFEFDAVNPDHSMAATISTSASRTASGNPGTGQMRKIRCDIYFLLLTSCERRLVVLTEQSMFDEWQKEVMAGRVPPSIEFVHAPIPESLAQRLRTARKRASDEVSPP